MSLTTHFLTIFLLVYEKKKKKRMGNFFFFLKSKKKKKKKGSEISYPSQGNEMMTPGYIKGLYQKNEVIPYMHILVYRIPGFNCLTRHIGGVFSTSPVDLKNQEQVEFFFFKRTT